MRPRLEAGQDVLIAMLAPDGVARWTTVLGSEKLDTVQDLAVDERGFITVTNTSVTANGASVFVARILDGGQVAWVKGIPEECTLAGLAVSPAGRIAVGVNASNWARVQLLDPAGNELATARFTPDPGHSVRIAALAIDANGSTVVAGDFEGGLDAAGTELVALGRDLFVARLAPDGAIAWARRFGDEQNQYAAGVALDGAGGVVVTGHEPVRQQGDRAVDDWFVLDLSP